MQDLNQTIEQLGHQCEQYKAQLQFQQKCIEQLRSEKEEMGEQNVTISPGYS